jgi:hypothetical protein
MVRANNGSTHHGMQTLMKLVKTNLMHRKRLDILRKPPDKPKPSNHTQMALNAAWI